MLPPWCCIIIIISCCVSLDSIVLAKSASLDACSIPWLLALQVMQLLGK
jgi:hypothetical protein